MGKKQKTDKDTVTVYWTADTSPERQTYAQILWGPPVPLIKLMPEGNGLEKTGNYRLCAALPTLLKNTYAFIHPLTHTASVSGDLFSPIIKSELDIWRHRESPLKNRYALEYDFGWLFFSDESLQIKVVPPYFHNTSASKTAFLSSGSFDIGKWFRRITMAYILWENETTLTFTKNDPAMYIEFVTDKKVILKQFECTEEITSIGTQTAMASSLFMADRSLNYRYSKFIQSNRHKRILKLIKDNLLD